MDVSSEPLIAKIAKLQDNYLKSQQKNSPDLTLNEKRQIVEEIFQQGPAKFLSRFHKFLDEDDVKYFQVYKDDYDIAFYLKEIIGRSKKRPEAETKNRRFAALQKLIEEGKYFSDHEMNNRNPELFHQFIGQYMSKSEKEEMDINADRDVEEFKLSYMLMRANDANKPKSCPREEEEEEEEDSSDDDSEPSAFSFVAAGNKSSKLEERLLLRQEFTSLMHQKFLNGEDPDFDYQSVDNSTDYDSCKMLDQDAEDKYFDSEEPM